MVSGGTEVTAPNDVFYIASVEYPLGGNSTPPMFTLNGKQIMHVGTVGSGTITDALGIAIPANTSFAIRYGTYVSAPPASLALSAATSGGTLAAGTYYYKATCVKDGAESGPTSEQSVTTTGSTSSVTLTATASPSPVGCDTIRIYRSTTTGTETYLASIVAPGLLYVDNGLLPTQAAAPVPATYPVYPNTDYNGLTYSSAQQCGGTNANLVEGTGTTGLFNNAVTNGSCTVNSPMVLGDDVSSKPICGLGDSIEAGLGVSGLIGDSNSSNINTLNWFGAGLPQGQYNSLNISIPSATIWNFVGSGSTFGGNLRLRALDFCSTVLSNLGTNDIYSGVSWQTVASEHIQLAKQQAARGKKYFITTLPPRIGNNTDNFTTLAGSPSGSFESVRVNYNTWIRNGMLVNAGAPVLSGGTATPYIAGYFDLDKAVGEVNSAGTPTPNGGYWPVPSVPYGTAVIGTVNSGLQFYILNWNGVSGAFAPANSLVGYVIKMASGADVGQTCIIASNSGTSGIINCTVGDGSGITGSSLAAGDAVNVYSTFTSDGIHPTYRGAQLIANGTSTSGYENFQTWATANLK